jgi:hypothetical protein
MRWADGYAKACLVILLSGISLFLSAQKKDSIKPPKDSLKLYKQIKRIAYKHKLTTTLFKSVFVDPEPIEYPKQPASKEKKMVNPYLKYRGQIIRSVTIDVYGPFGRALTDTAPPKLNIIQKAGNQLHVRTHPWIIANRLLFRKNDTLKALNISESERLLREAPYINDARILVIGSPRNDSVDIRVLVQDKWPLSASAGIDDMHADLNFRNSNFLGSGQQFYQHSGIRRPDIYDISGYYQVLNIDRTYISGTAGYAINKDSRSVSLAFDRPFYSPLANWAGGASATYAWKHQMVANQVVGLQTFAPLDLANFDFWFGKSFKPWTSKQLFNQSTNLVTSLRWFGYRFTDRPNFANLNLDAVIGNIGISVQQFYKEKFVYRFGANEDVPQGFLLQYLYGCMQREEGKLRYYSGFEIARAAHNRLGYFSGSFSTGVFFNDAAPNDVTTTGKIYYFTDLFRIGRWYFREFVNITGAHGENRAGGELTTITKGELFGFKNGNLYGTTKAVVTGETVAYMPYNLIGFRFAPVFMAGVGMVGNVYEPFNKGRVYQAYSLGILVRNENLLNKTFQISVGFYPFFPDGRINYVEYNPVTSFTLKVRGFSIGKPDFISY